MKNLDIDFFNEILNRYHPMSKMTNFGVFDKSEKQQNGKKYKKRKKKHVTKLRYTTTERTEQVNVKIPSQKHSP